MKILNYTLFVCSNSVKRLILSKGVDPDTAFLNDYKFMKACMHILVSINDINFKDNDFWVPSKHHFRSILQVRLR